VAHAAVTEAPRSAESRGNRAADGRAAFHKRRIERQILPASGERRADFTQRCSRERGGGELARIILDDVAEPPRGNQRDIVAHRREPRLRPRADREHARMRADGVAEFVYICGSEHRGFSRIKGGRWSSPQRSDPPQAEKPVTGFYRWAAAP